MQRRKGYLACCYNVSQGRALTNASNLLGIVIFLGSLGVDREGKILD